VVDLPKNQEKALNVALNKISGDWDFSQLSIVLSELKEADFDISITGFSDSEFDRLLQDLNIPETEKEYDESVADGVEMLTCPHCGKEFPK